MTGTSPGHDEKGEAMAGTSPGQNEKGLFLNQSPFALYSRNFILEFLADVRQGRIRVPRAATHKQICVIVQKSIELIAEFRAQMWLDRSICRQRGHPHRSLLRRHVFSTAGAYLGSLSLIMYGDVDFWA
jgi:hypothetical protein